MGFELTECPDDSVWDKWVASSPQGTPFCSSWLLHTLDATARRFLLLEDGEPVVGGIIFQRNGQILRAPLPSCFYQGLLFGPSSQEPIHRIARKHLEWTEAFLANLENQVSTISLCLHPSSPDIRGFSWFHYHEPARGMFEIQVRYTGIIDLMAFDSCEPYLATARELRRREYAKSVKRGCRVSESTCEDQLVPLFRETFARQNIECSAEQLDFVGRIARAAVAQGAGQILHCHDESGQVVSATLFLHDTRMSYYLFGANGAGAASCGGGTRVMVDAFFKARERGCQFVDLLGLNSPGRGDFKTSFNALPTPYFHVHWDTPGQP